MYGNYDAATDGALTGAAVADQINISAATTGVRATFSGGNLTFSTTDGRDIDITENAVNEAGEGLNGTLTDNAAATIDYAATGAVAGSFGGTLTLSAAETITLGGGDEAAAGFTAAQAIAVDANTLSTVSMSRPLRTQRTPFFAPTQRCRPSAAFAASSVLFSSVSNLRS